MAPSRKKTGLILAMKIVDPYRLEKPASVYNILVAASSPTEKSNPVVRAEVLLEHATFLAYGLKTTPHSQLATELAWDTVHWAYKKLGQVPRYQEERSWLLTRLFRATNLTLWQKQREPEFSAGLEATMAAGIFSEKKAWVAAVGTSTIYLYRDGLITPLISPDVDKSGTVRFCLGRQRFAFSPNIALEAWSHGDIVVALTAELAAWWEEEDLRAWFSQLIPDQTKLEKAIDDFIHPVGFDCANQAAWLVYHVNKLAQV